MAMNTSKIITGGLVAGVVLNVVDFIINWVMKARMEAETRAVAPAIADKMAGNMTTMIVSYVLLDFLLGILVVWLYAAIRPRYGGGPGTALKAAVYIWFLLGIAYSGYFIMGMMSAGTFIIFSCVGLINVVLAAMVGGRLYTEEGATAA